MTIGYRTEPASARAAGQPRRNRQGIHWAQARSIAGLKVSIIRRSPHILLGMALGLLAGLGLTTGALVAVWSARSRAEGSSMLMLGLSLLVVLWILAPIVVGGGETVLDLRALAVQPITMPTMVAGIVASAFVGSPAFMTLIVGLSALSHVNDGVAALLVVVGAVEFTLTAVLAGRVSVSALNVLAGSRFRSMAAAFTVMAAVSLGAVAQFLPRILSVIRVEWFEPIRQVVRWSPLGWSPEAMTLAIEGRTGPALIFLALGALAPVLGLVALRWVLGLLVIRSGGGATTSTRARDLSSPWTDRLVGPKTAVAWSKSVRSLRRDPREWTEVAAFLPLVLIFAVPAVTELDNIDPRLTLFSFTAATAGLVMTCGNLFGADGAAFTADAIPGDDFRPVLVGKLLARGLLVLVMVAFGGVAMAAMTGGWIYLPVTLLLTVQSVLLACIPAVFVSIRAPVPLPDKIGGFNTNNAGCITPLLLMASLTITGAVSVLAASPAIILALLVDPLVALAAPAVSVPLVAWLVHRRIDSEAIRLANRVPEMVTALTRA